MDRTVGPRHASTSHAHMPSLLGCASWNNQWENSHQRLARNNQREIVANGAWNNQRGMAGLERFMEQSAGNGCRGNASWLGTISGEMVAVAAPAPSTLMDKVADCEGARHHHVILGAGKFCCPDSPAWCRVPHKHASITTTCATPPPTRATRESPPPSRCLSRSASPRSMFASSGLVVAAQGSTAAAANVHGTRAHRDAALAHRDAASG